MKHLKAMKSINWNNSQTPIIAKQLLTESLKKLEEIIKKRKSINRKDSQTMSHLSNKCATLQLDYIETINE